ncbi:MAG: endonuclease [Solirubrobacteraceae bacterium]|jgi:hypothetical protein|nr:endonuclease [Solirubrobacteraceae bacterium]
MARVTEIWERDGERCLWCGAASWARDRTVEHLLPRSRGGSDDQANLLPACRACNRARRSQSAVAYARECARAGKRVQVDLLLRGLDRLAAQGAGAERRHGARQAEMVRDWQRAEAAVAAHLERLAG